MRAKGAQARGAFTLGLVAFAPAAFNANQQTNGQCQAEPRQQFLLTHEHLISRPF